MRPFGRKIHWPIKALSNKNYISEVSIDGKKTSRFNFHLGYFDLYIAQVMRSGNCLTLLSSPISFSAEHFKNANLLEDMVKYVFWTFNESFLLRAINFLPRLTQSELQTSQQFLENNPTAFGTIDGNNADEELVWCLVKNEHLKADPKFVMMYQKDEENRKALLEAVMERINSLATVAEENDIPAASAKVSPEIPVAFLDMLMPLDNDVQNTLSYIQSIIKEAQFPHNIFLHQPKDRKGRNQTGLNSEIAAMVYLFQKKGYFLPKFTFKEIFRAFGIHSGNSSGKDYDYSYFTEDYSFGKYLKLLQSANIKQLSSL